MHRVNKYAGFLKNCHNWVQMVVWHNEEENHEWKA